MEQTKLIQVRASQDLHSRLAAVAAADRRSIAAEALVLLERAVEQREQEARSASRED